MQAAQLPQLYTLALAIYNYPGKTFSPTSSFMWVVGIIASTLFAAGISGIPMLLTSPFWVIYIMLNAQGGSGTFATYQSTIANMASADSFGYLLQSYLLPWFHLSTGQVSTLIFAIFKWSGVETNLAAMVTNPSDSSSTAVAQRNSYAVSSAVGMWLGAAIGVFTILPTTIVGFLTLPITGPIVFWKVLDQCSATPNFFNCATIMLPWTDLYLLSFIGYAKGYPLY